MSGSPRAVEDWPVVQAGWQEPPFPDRLLGLEEG